MADADNSAERAGILGKKRGDLESELLKEKLAADYTKYMDLQRLSGQQTNETARLNQSFKMNDPENESLANLRNAQANQINYETKQEQTVANELFPGKIKGNKLLQDLTNEIYTNPDFTQKYAEKMFGIKPKEVSTDSKIAKPPLSLVDKPGFFEIDKMMSEDANKWNPISNNVPGSTIGNWALRRTRNIVASPFRALGETAGYISDRDFWNN